MKQYLTILRDRARSHTFLYEMKTTRVAILFAPLLLAGILGAGCNRGQNASKPDKAVMDAPKPEVDPAKVIELGELYRARRFEDLQTAMAAGPETVRKISFHGRKIGSLTGDIARFPYLATLDVARNDLAELPEELSELHYLQGFYANVNRLQEFPGQILLLPVLARLNLSENQITRIPPEIMKMDQLDYLALEKNQITRIPVQLYELKNLTALNLSYNGLGSLPEGISGLTSLRKLDLAHNQLTALPKDLPSMGTHLEELMIHGNQIPEEDVEWLVEAMPNTKIRF